MSLSPAGTAVELQKVVLQIRAGVLQNRAGRRCKSARVVLQIRAALLQIRAPVQLLFTLLLLFLLLKSLSRDRPMIVTCQKCGTSIPPDDKLCEDCGNVCRSCHTPIPPGDNYCDGCLCPQCHIVKAPDDRLCPECQDIEDEARQMRIALLGITAPNGCTRRRHIGTTTVEEPSKCKR